MAEAVALDLKEISFRKILSCFRVIGNKIPNTVFYRAFGPLTVKVIV